MLITEVQQKGNQILVTYYKRNDSVLESAVSISEDNLRDFVEDGDIEVLYDSYDHLGQHVQENFVPSYEDLTGSKSDLEELIKIYVKEVIHKSKAA